MRLQRPFSGYTALSFFFTPPLPVFGVQSLPPIFHPYDPSLPTIFHPYLPGSLLTLFLAPTQTLCEDTLY